MRRHNCANSSRHIDFKEALWAVWAERWCRTNGQRVKVVHQSHLNWMAAFQESLLNGVYVNIFIENIFKGEQTFICDHFFGFIVNQESEMCVSASPHTSLSPSSDRWTTLNWNWTPPPPSGCLIMSLHLISTDPHLSLSLSLPPSGTSCSASLAKLWTPEPAWVHIQVQDGLRVPPLSWLKNNHLQLVTPVVDLHVSVTWFGRLHFHWHTETLQHDWVNKIVHNMNTDFYSAEMSLTFSVCKKVR